MSQLERKHYLGRPSVHVEVTACERNRINIMLNGAILSVLVTPAMNRMEKRFYSFSYNIFVIIIFSRYYYHYYFVVIIVLVIIISATVDCYWLRN